METEIIEAQKRLEQRRSEVASSRPMDPTPIGSVLDLEHEARICRDCGEGFIPPGGLDYTRCPSCIDKRRQAQYEENKRKAKEQDDALRAARIERLTEAIRIGKRYSGQLWEDYEPPTDTANRVLSACRAYAEGFGEALEVGRCLVMVGGPGTGKNMLSALICREVVSQGHTALHTTAMKLVRRVKETWAKGSEETETQAIRNFTLPELLVIDEVGVQFGSQAEQIILTEIINDRYEAMRPTIIISNLTVPQLEEVMGKRVMDRFYENGGRVLAFNWQSWRRQGVSTRQNGR